MMRASLKELDGSLFNKEDFINKQNGKLAEKDRVIQSQKADMERLEKKTKMQEYKVWQTILKMSLLIMGCYMVSAK